MKKEVKFMVDMFRPGEPDATAAINRVMVYHKHGYTYFHELEHLVHTPDARLVKVGRRNERIIYDLNELFSTFEEAKRGTFQFIFKSN